MKRRKTSVSSNGRKERREKEIRIRVRLSGCPEIRKVFFNMREVVYLGRVAVAG
jgi:hypothetical protein